MLRVRKYPAASYRLPAPAARRQREGSSTVRKNLQTARKAKGMTQQALADELGIGLRHYQKIEYAEINGSFEVWDALEDILGVHQRKLRENSGNHLDQEENQ